MPGINLIQRRNSMFKGLGISVSLIIAAMVGLPAAMVALV